jgi:hypothetical protein
MKGLLRYFVMFIFLTSHGIVCMGATETLTGEEEAFWDKRAAVLGKVLSVTNSDSSVHFRLQILGVVTTDIYVPSEIDVSYLRRRNSPLIGLDVATGKLLLLCVEEDDGKWTLPPIRTGLFDTGVPAIGVPSSQDPGLMKYFLKVWEAKKRSVLKTAVSGSQTH